MKWKKVNITLPKEISNLYNRIYKIQKNSCIAGGFLSDLYMKKPYNDVDFFIKDDEVKQTKIENLLVSLGYSKSKSENNENPYKLAFHVETYQKKNWNIQLVFTDLGIKHVKYFDFRFREFFYLNSQCYATEEALSDIKNKVLSLGVPSYCMKTFFRIYQFKEKYGFSVDKNSLNRFSYVFNEHNYSRSDAMKFLKKNYSSISPMVAKIVDKYYDNYADRIKLPTTLSHDNLPYGLVEKINQYPLERDLFEMAFTPRKFKLLDSFNFTEDNWNNLKNHRNKVIKNLIKEITKQRIRFVSAGIGDVYAFTIKNLNEMDENDDVSNVLAIKKKFIKLNHDFTDRFYSRLEHLERFDKVFNDLQIRYKSHDLEIKVFNQYKFIRVRNACDLADYAKENLILFDFPIVGNFSFNLRTKKIQDSTGFSVLHDSIEDFIIDNYLQKAIS